MPSSEDSNRDWPAALLGRTGLSVVWLVFYLVLLGHGMTSSHDVRDALAKVSPRDSVVLSADRKR